MLLKTAFCRSNSAWTCSVVARTRETASHLRILFNEPCWYAVLRIRENAAEQPPHSDCGNGSSAVTDI